MSDSATKERASLHDLGFDEQIPPAWEHDTITLLVGTTKEYEGQIVANHPFNKDQKLMPLKGVLNDIGKSGWTLGQRILDTSSYVIVRALPLDKRPIFTEQI